MNSLSKYIFLVIAILIVSCKNEETPKVIYDETKSTTVVEVKIDSSSIKIADLPILMEGTKYLIHPVGDIRVYDDFSKVYGSSKTNQGSYAISNYSRFEITGYFDNLKFQHIDSTNVVALTDNKVQIQTVTYLNSIADNNKAKILVYTLVDADTNKDGKVNQNDIKSLYVSNADGTKFTKLSIDFQELIDWNIIEAQNRLYFRCIEDINKNGAFDKKDKVHYHFVNLLAEEWKVEEYMPI
jgi:PBP1b-binding outer membrane lipoprotein LpoB